MRPRRSLARGARTWCRARPGKQALAEALGHRSFVLLVLGYFTCGFQLQFVTLHLPSYLIDRGLSVEVGGWTLGIIGLFNIVGALLSGYLASRMPKRYILAFIYSTRALAVIFLITMPAHPAVALIYGAVTGLLWLSSVPPTSGLVAVMFGPRWLSMLIGITFLSHQIGGFARRLSRRPAVRDHRLVQHHLVGRRRVRHRLGADQPADRREAGAASGGGARGGVIQSRDHQSEVSVATFKAIVIEKTDNGQTVALKDFDEANLMEGDVDVRVEWSTVNYKDGLAVTGKAPVVRRWPMIAGIDFAGTVEKSSHADWKPGDKVILNGWGLGETHLGAYGQKARVKGEWLVRLPPTMSGRDAMSIGTAGYTAMLAVMALEKHGITPDRGPQIVTGAAGGVGSVAVALLARLGYAVTASTGRPEEADYLKRLGATEVIERKELSGTPRSLAKERWAGGIDSVGSTTLANVLSMMRYRGAVAACGLGRRYGFADVGRAVHFARGVTFGHRLRPLPASGPRSCLETARNRPRSGEIGGDDRRNRPVGRHGGGPADHRRACPRSNRGQDWVNTFTIWRRSSGRIGRSHG